MSEDESAGKSPEKHMKRRVFVIGVFVATLTVVSRLPELERAMKSGPGHSEPSVGAPGASTLRQSSPGLELDVPFWTLIDGGAFSVSVEPGTGRRDSLVFMYAEDVPADLTGAVVPVDPSVSPGFYETTQEFSSSMSIVDISCRSSSQVFVCGNPIGRGGVIDTAKTQIQEWTISSALGSITTERPDSSVSIGVPAPEMELEVSIVGPAYLPPASRARSTVQRENVVTINGPISAMCADPDGRYLLLAQPEVGILQVDLTVQGVVSANLIIPATQSNHLDSVSNLSFGKTLGGDKVVRAESGGSYEAYCTDSDNDGFFESVTSFSFTEAQDAGLNSPSAWSSDYRHFDMSGVLFGN